MFGNRNGLVPWRSSHMDDSNGILAKAKIQKANCRTDAVVDHAPVEQRALEDPGMYSMLLWSIVADWPGGS